jgi:hypothetical protein
MTILAWLYANSAITTAIAALFGGLVSVPLAEVWKDTIGAGRQWRTQRSEIITTLRMVLGLLDAFSQVRGEAFEPIEGLPLSFKFRKEAAERLCRFNLEFIDTSLLKLAVLHPKQSERSGAAQRLIQEIVVLRGHCEQVKLVACAQVKKSSEHEGILALSDFDKSKFDQTNRAFETLRWFLIAVYCDRIKIDGFSTFYDLEIHKAEVIRWTRISEQMRRNDEELFKRIREVTSQRSNLDSS